MKTNLLSDLCEEATEPIHNISLQNEEYFQ